ncbi:MAG: hypothetical protein II863_08315, partial [Kiritimatiellae bacterium]|nr:hypothetical protein [Kiritimatiellia bacterium]
MINRLVILSAFVVSFAASAGEALTAAARMLESEMKRNPVPCGIDKRKKPKWEYTDGLELQAALAVAKRCPELRDKTLAWAQDYIDRMVTKDGEIGNVMVVFGKGNPLDLGDTLELNGKTLHVSALLSDSPFSESGIPTVICSEETFEDFCGASNYSVIDLQLKKSAGDETVAQIRELLSDNLGLSDRRASKTEVNSTYLAFAILVY